MIIELSVAIAAIIPIMLIGKIIATIITRWRWAVPLVQSALTGAAGFIIVQLTPLTMILVVGMAAAPWLLNITALVYKIRQMNKALNGGYGKSVKWAAEIEQDGDALFTMAMNALPDSEMREIGIIAEDKEELRELAVERFEEQADDNIPEEFMQ